MGHLDVQTCSDLLGFLYLDGACIKTLTCNNFSIKKASLNQIFDINIKTQSQVSS